MITSATGVLGLNKGKVFYLLSMVPVLLALSVAIMLLDFTGMDGWINVIMHVEWF